MSMWLACNRPVHSGALDDGSGYWSVPIIVEAFTTADSIAASRPDCSAATPPRSRACIAVVNTMRRLSTQTQGVCADITRIQLGGGSFGCDNRRRYSVRRRRYPCRHLLPH